ncbi:ABC transporter substrate-binding protein [Thermoanaerobacterium thermosaccharolyticum]|uniref:ABC transporter substrate-binding protein n=1 Tax=Thermoanaerobacterium thermosaccharolyticum TaxID=1517 RepID=A0A231VFD0_THETR|nr:sugar ABC transporter substrate-binding protein [Thermoanaerobacterium thermosaccharolyticum]OXT06731.1 ABC transporter substrate-binding protein [Thermoanaerobacterium thermosaccharolyticum]
MNKLFKSFSLMLTFVLILSMFSGCSQSNKNTSTNNSNSQNVSSQSKKTTIKFVVWDYSKAPEYKDIIDAFEKENPDITVEPVEIAAANYDQKLTVMLAGGDTSDVIAVKDMPSYSNYVSKNQIISLDDYIKNDNIDMKPYNGIENSLRIDGKIYGLPYRSDFWVLYYNKDIFDKAKVPYPSNDMTWDQFRELAKKLTSGSGNNQIWGAYIHTWKSAVMDWAVADKKGTLVDGNYEFLKPAYDVFLPMQNIDKSIMPLSVAKASNSSYTGVFETGKAAMLPMGTWFIGTLLTDKKAGNTNVNWSIVKAPHFPGGKAGMTFGNVTPVAINSASKNKDAAWKFVKFMGSEEAAKILARHGVMPAYRTDDVMNTYTNTEGFPSDGKDALVTESVQIEFPPDKDGAAIDQMLQEEHELIMIGQNSVDKGIAEMNKRFKEIRNQSK